MGKTPTLRTTMKKICDRCGAINPTNQLGGAILCRTCNTDIKPEIEALREEGKPVNVLHIARKHFKKNHSGGTYMIRDIPKKILNEWKMRAIEECGNQRDIVFAALVEYLEK